MESSRRRSALCVPASEPLKIAKALASGADEVIVDLEDAVAPHVKETARGSIESLHPRERGTVAVRVNAHGTPWHEADLAACAKNPAVASVVLPKVEHPADVAATIAVLDTAGRPAGATPLTVQALIESPAALTNATAIAAASPRLVSLIIGYADLSASLGRRLDASWQFARDIVLLAARTAGIQAIDGPHLTVADDDGFAAAVELANVQGFDGKWVIHPRQIARIQTSFTPPDDEVADATEIVRVMEEAMATGAGAISWRGRMLDEALVVAARRIIARADTP